MEQEISIIQNVLRQKGVHSNRIDFLVKYLMDRPKILERLFKAEEDDKI